jgi:hypothetical protein
MSKQQDTGYLEEKEFVVKEFLWVDGEFSCSSGALLSILNKLGNNEPVTITDNDIAGYLKTKNLIEEDKKSSYLPSKGKTVACITLGNNIARAVDKALSKINPEQVEYLCKQPVQDECK